MQTIVDSEPRSTTRAHSTDTIAHRRQRPHAGRIDHLGTVTCITRSDIPAVAALAARHTHSHPAARWLVPDPLARHLVLRRWYTILVEHALAHGYADILADHTGVAIWLDRTQPLPRPAGYPRRLREACGEYLEAALLLTEVLDRHRPSVAHLHLAVLATEQPAAAQALLAHRHLRLDRTGVATYALADTQERLDVLVGAGYEPGDEVRLPAGPVLRPTWRPAGRDLIAAVAAAA